MFQPTAEPSFLCRLKHHMVQMAAEVGRLLVPTSVVTRQVPNPKKAQDAAMADLRTRWAFESGLMGAIARRAATLATELSLPDG
jgi:hypothetical protein